MQPKATTVADYRKDLPAKRQEVIRPIRKVQQQHPPEEFKETIGYGMVTYLVPHSLYPASL